MKKKSISSPRRATLAFFAILTLLMSHCKPKSADSGGADDSGLKISLAQWSIHRSLENGTLRAENFAAIAKNDFGINAVEYVNGFYKDHATDESFWKKMRATADSLGVKSLLIMVDEEGDLGSPDAAARKKAVENHFKWVDAAKILGCHSIRVNAFGEGTKEEMRAAMVDALKQLCGYAQKNNINVLIENHGLYSSDGQWVASVIRGVNMSNCGTLPDFGNWCTAEKWGSTEGSKNCKEVYDRYKGVSEMLPFAKGISAKSYAFNDQGEETIIDFSKMLKMVKESPDFTGYVDIEYEGSPLSEPNGIIATKALLEKTWKNLSTEK
ncbi:MAG TPA: sugar phosphate isomerase/epimerase family protein [Cyclobacteriaceae bacterium]|nr:sugar phosphate isomerase/epimerase family protein [Cyclobacteriaceae bacterium]